MVDEGLTGYLSGEYAAAFQEWGKPIRLPRSKSWVLRRPIPGSNYYDAMGLYPLMCCEGWGSLETDMSCLYDLVSLAFVSDPFAEDWDDSWLDLCAPYKLRRVVDYTKRHVPTKHHRYYAKNARCKVELAIEPDLDTWCNLYTNLVERHGITGIQAFSRESFEYQLAAPGLITFQAYDRKGVMAMHLWYVQGDAAYSHLAACSDRGYDNFAAYALMDEALRFFAGNVKHLDLGATPDSADGKGLDFFKKGWSNDSRLTKLCGKILDFDKYKELSNGKSAYFPAYRG